MKRILKILATGLRSGLVRTVKSLKAVFIIWLASLLFVFTLAYPLQSSLKTSFKGSMINEKLYDAFDVTLFSDLGPSLAPFISSLSVSVILVLAAGFFINVFFTAGLFGSLRSDVNRFSISVFFRTATIKFWQFLGITIVMRMIIFLSGLFLVGLPLVFTELSGDLNSGPMLIILCISAFFFLLVIPLLLLVSDFARAYNVSGEGRGIFTSLGYGFKRTFRTFWSSFTFVWLLLILQAAWIAASYCFFAGWRPSGKGGVFLLFLSTQVMIAIRLFLKTWRYAGVTSIMEEYGSGRG